jgi:glycosyltransferase involved in cell wall biosynthesis
MTAPRILFVLPARGASGGANSVVQECIGLSRIGCRMGLAVPSKHTFEFGLNYPELRSSTVDVQFYEDTKQLAQIMPGYDVVTATINNSVPEIAAAIQPLGDRVKSAYYIQDYEPLFYPVDSNDWKRARESYALIKDCALFAKTDWIRDVVYANHGVSVAKVAPSLDHDTFYPDAGRHSDALTIVAMLRPKTPRRAPHRTSRVLSRLAEELPRTTVFKVFGSSSEQLLEHGIDLPPRIQNVGLLRRTAVADLMRSADLFLDLSDYQAFGRSGLEAMACGCVPVLPIMGGVAEFAEHGRNAFIVDTRSDELICQAVRQFAEMPPRYRADMRHEGLMTASGFSIGRAVTTEFQFFQGVLNS